MFDQVDPATVDSAALAVELTAHARRLAVGMARFLRLLAEFDRREAWVDWGSKSCVDWLAWKCGLSQVAAREQVRVARALANLPLVANAFAEGRLSYSKVRALTRAATPSTEETFLALATDKTAADLETIVSKHRLALAVADPVHRHRQRSLNHYFDESGCLVLSARLAPEEGAVVLRALEAATKQIVLERSREGASAEAPTIDDLDAPPPWQQDRADALVAVAEGFLCGATPSGDSERALIVIHTDAGTLAGDVPDSQPELADGPPLHVETARRLACDGAVLGVQTLASGESSIGRRARVVPRSMRRALALRDRRCRFPSCRAHRMVDAHHITHWARGGETALDNLVLLCRHHHRLVHEAGFKITGRPDGELRFMRPDGGALEADAHVPAAGSHLSDTG